MSEFTFKPEKSYDGLLRQANAMAILIRAMEKTRTFQNLTIGEMAREIALQGFEEINAQRNTNEILTNELEVLQTRIGEIERLLCSACDKLSVMPISEEWAARFCNDVDSIVNT